MTTGRNRLEEIVRGLDGVTAGPWLEDGRHVFIDTRGQVCCGRGVEVGCPEGGSMLECCGNPDVEGDYFAIAEGMENNIPHIARCSPDAIREIAAYVRDLEERLAKAAEALEPFADAADYYSTGVHRHIAEDALPCGPALLVRHLRSARTALSQIRSEK